MKTEVSLTYCNYLNKVPEEINKHLTVEMHHYPLTLYDIVSGVLNKYVMQRKAFTRLSIANEVMDLHFSLQISIIPLTLTLHQLAHTNNLLISTKNVFGDYRKFMMVYDIFLNEDKKEDILKIEKMSDNEEEYMIEFNKDTLRLDTKGLLGIGLDEEIQEEDPPF